MEKVILIGEQEVKLKATAGTSIRYSNNFGGRDILKDIIALSKKLEKVKSKDSMEQFEAIDLQMFSEIAWAMAKTADNSIPPLEQWLDNFEMFSIMQVLPDIIELMVANMSQKNESKKKLEQVAGN